MKYMHTDQPERVESDVVDEITIVDVDVTGTDQLCLASFLYLVLKYLSQNSVPGMTTGSKRTSDEMKAELEVKSEAGSELEELNEEEYERERLENIKYVPLSDHCSSNLLHNTKPFIKTDRNSRLSGRTQGPDLERADSRNNAALLDSLGLSSKPSIRPREVKVEKGNAETRLKKESSVKRRKVVMEPTRRSGRVRAMEIDEEEGKKRKYV
jgi:hypothetical protein